MHGVAPECNTQGNPQLPRLSYLWRASCIGLIGFGRQQHTEASRRVTTVAFLTSHTLDSEILTALAFLVCSEKKLQFCERQRRSPVWP